MNGLSLRNQLSGSQYCSHQTLSNIIVAEGAQNSVVEFILEVWFKPDISELVQGNVVEHRVFDSFCKGVVTAELFFGEVREVATDDFVATSAHIGED